MAVKCWCIFRSFVMLTLNEYICDHKTQRKVSYSVNDPQNGGKQRNEFCIKLKEG